MTTPPRAPAPYRPVPPSQAGDSGVVVPSAIAQAKPSATFALGGILRKLIDHSLAFASENAKLAAHQVVDDFINSHVGFQEMQALATGEERAPVEDVTKRVAPGGAPQLQLPSAPLDYTKLAQAILAEQARLSAQPQIPEKNETEAQ
jgi:hypothetical protein